MTEASLSTRPLPTNPETVPPTETVCEPPLRGVATVGVGAAAPPTGAPPAVPPAFPAVAGVAGVAGISASSATAASATAAAGVAAAAGVGTAAAALTG